MRLVTWHIWSQGEGKEEQEYKNEPQSDYQKKLRRESSVLHNHC